MKTRVIDARTKVLLSMKNKQRSMREISHSIRKFDADIRPTLDPLLFRHLYVCVTPVVTVRAMSAFSCICISRLAGGRDDKDQKKRTAASIFDRDEVDEIYCARPRFIVKRRQQTGRFLPPILLEEDEAV